MQPLWLFDIDGTIACSAHRREYAERGEWHLWYQERLFALDTPIAEVTPFFSRGVFRYGEHAFLTGRSELSREWTLTWLVKHGFATPSTPLLMRQPHDEGNVRIHEIKRQELRAMGCARPVVLFEDHPETVAAIRSDEALSYVTVVHAPHETVPYLLKRAA